MSKNIKSSSQGRKTAMCGIALASVSSLVLMLLYMPNTSIPDGIITVLVVIQIGIVATAAERLMRDP